MSEADDIKRLFRETRLRQVITQHRAVLLVGAGFSRKEKSVPGGLGADIAMRLLGRINDRESEESSKESEETCGGSGKSSSVDPAGLRSSDLSLSRISQRFEKTFGTDELHSTVLDHCREFLHNEPCDHHELLAKLDPFRFIITTNWDHLIEDAYRKPSSTQRRKFQTVCNTQELRNVIGRSRTVLIKLNGDLKREWSGWQVKPRITTREMFSLEKEEPGLWEFVRAVFVAHIPIIVGFNPHDRNLIELLKWREEAIGQAAEIVRPFLIDPNETLERDLPVKISYVKATGSGFMKYIELVDSMAGGETRIWKKETDTTLDPESVELYTDLNILQKGPLFSTSDVTSFPTDDSCYSDKKNDIDKLGLSARLGSQLYKNIQRVEVVGTDKDVGPDVLRKAVAKRASCVVTDILISRKNEMRAEQVLRPLRITLSCGRTIQDVIGSTTEVMEGADLEILSTTLTLIDESDLTSSSGLVAKYVQQLSDLAGSDRSGHFSVIKPRVSGVAPRLSTTFAAALVKSKIYDKELGDLEKQIEVLKTKIKDSKNIKERLSHQDTGDQTPEGNPESIEIMSPGRTAIVVRDHIDRVLGSDVVLLGVGPLLSKNSTFQRYAGACARSCSYFVDKIDEANEHGEPWREVQLRAQADKYASVCVKALYDVLGTFGEATYKPFLLRKKPKTDQQKKANWICDTGDYAKGDFAEAYKSGDYDMAFLRPCDVFVPYDGVTQYIDLDEVNEELSSTDGFGSYQFKIRKEIQDSIDSQLNFSEKTELSEFFPEFYARMFLHTCGPTSNMLKKIIHGDKKGKILLVASGVDKAMPSLGIIGLGICSHLIADESCARRMAELLSD